MKVEGTCPNLEHTFEVADLGCKLPCTFRRGNVTHTVMRSVARGGLSFVDAIRGAAAAACVRFLHALMAGSRQSRLLMLM